MCGYTLGTQNVAYCFWVTVTLTLSSDPSHRKIVCRAHIVYYFMEGTPNLEWIHVRVPECLDCFGVTLTLTSGTSPILLEEESQI